MKKLLVLLVSLLITNLVSSQLPNKFTLTEDIVSIGTDFTLSGISGTIEEQVISLTTNFTLKLNGLKRATAKQRLVSIGSVIDIYDESNIKIGTVKELIFNSFGIYSKYEIYDKNGLLIGTSEKHQLMSTKFIIKDKNGINICTISRPALNFTDKWTFNFDSDKYDKRLFIFIPCYKTLRDNED